MVHGRHLTHFGHANVLKHCNRPFSSIQEMDDMLIDNINACVKPKDILYHLGDFSWRKQTSVTFLHGGNDDKKTYHAQFYLDQINCKNIVLIAGNHDPHYKNGVVRKDFARLFKECHSLLRIKVNVRDVPQQIVLCHYAMRVWDRSHYRSISLYGHSHYSLPDDPMLLSIDVGIDAVAGRATGYSHKELQSRSELLKTENYKPISLDETLQQIAEKFICKNLRGF